jgi:hypothetical protein
MWLAKWFLPALFIGLGVAVWAWLAAGDVAAPGVAQSPPEKAAILGPVPARDRVQAPEWARVIQLPRASGANTPQTVAACPPIPAPDYRFAPRPTPQRSPPQAPESIAIRAPSLGRAAASTQAGAPPPIEPEPPTGPPRWLEAVKSDTQQTQPPVPSFGQRAMGEEPRYLPPEHRTNTLGAYGGPPPYMPPWFAPYDYNLERYRDARQSHFRQQRNFHRRRATGWMDDICPWTKPRRSTRSAQRRNPWQMEPPNRPGQFQQLFNRK